jgi:putative hydrolase
MEEQKMPYIIDLHCHTISSGHAYSTLQENIAAAVDKKIKILGMSDHGPDMPGGPHPYHFYNLKVIPKEINGVRILKGIEANILDFDGNVDMPNEILQLLDYTIASLHEPCIKQGTIDENTRAVTKAMENPYIKIIGHPDDSRYPLDYETIVKSAKKCGVLLELNNSSLNPNSFRVGAWENMLLMLKLCKEFEVKIILGTDTHISYEVGEFSNCIKLLKEADFPENLVVNTGVEKLGEYIKL